MVSSMRQVTIRTFFTRPKSSEKVPDEEERAAKKQKTEDLAVKDPDPAPAASPVPTVKKSGRSELETFKRGNKPDPDFFKSPASQERHEKFIEKIGRPKRSKYRSDTAHARKLTPLDEQYIEIKRQHMDTILIVEVGYKYKIFGRDAQIATKLFGWALMSGWLNIDEGDPVDALYDRFALCSFPVARLPFYVQKLINAGHKVGVVNQTETSALKSVGDNKRGPFRREVTAIYTKGTYIDELDSFNSRESSQANLSGHITAIVEHKNSSTVRKYGLVSVQPSTGDIIYDEFEDSHIASELETRLLHIQPCEIISIGELSGTTKKLIGTVATRGKNVRLESQPLLSDDEVYSTLEVYPYSQKLPILARQSAAILVKYLEHFKLAQVFTLDAYNSFTMSSHMVLNGNALTALEIFQNLTDYTANGSLFWVMNQTMTPFGQRLFKKWVAQPLLNRELLMQRIEAYRELITGYCDPFDKIKTVMGRLPDLERTLLQIHYRRIAPKQLFFTLLNFQKVTSAFTVAQIRAQKLKSPILNELLEQIPLAREFVDSCLKRIDSNNAKESKLMSFFREDNDHPSVAEILEQKKAITAVGAQFDEHLKAMQDQLNIPLKFVNIASDEYLIEAKASDVKKLPTDWQKMGGTKTLIRYRTPVTHVLIKDLQLAKERLDVVLDAVYQQFVTELADKYDVLRNTVVALANLDCLMSLASISTKQGYALADYVDEPCLEITKGRHPMIDELLLKGFIPNDVRMYKQSNRAMIVTGPNMGGKSSYVRQVALILIMAQVGSYVPASSARLSLVDAIFTRMGAYDNMLKGESTFQVELKECSDILANATPRSLVVLDEIGRGTGTTDGMAIAYAVLNFIVTEIKCFTLFITHYPLLTELEQAFPKIVSNWSMDYDKDDETKLVTFLYTLTQKPAYRSYGLNVARLASLDESIINIAEQKSHELEQELVSRRSANLLRAQVSELLKGSTEDTSKLFEQIKSFTD